MHLTTTPSREVAQMLASTTSKWGLNKEVQDALLRVRTGPECPGDNLRELTWASNPNCGIAREREKKERERKRENFPAKNSNLRHYQACSQNKGLSEYQRRASWLRTRPSTAGGREAGGQQPEPERGNLSPWDSILYQTSSRLPVANQVFLGSWTVDIHQEGHSQRSPPQRRHTAHLRRCSRCTPRKLSSWDGGDDKTSWIRSPHTWGECTHQVPGHLSCMDLGRAQNAGPTESVLLCGVPENLNLSGLELGSASNLGPTLDSSTAEQPGAWAK